MRSIHLPATVGLSLMLLSYLVAAFDGDTPSACSHLLPEKDDVVYNVHVERDARIRRSTEVRWLPAYDLLVVIKS